MLFRELIGIACEKHMKSLSVDVDKMLHFVVSIILNFFFMKITMSKYVIGHVEYQ
jgi:hypothetical protein